MQHGVPTNLTVTMSSRANDIRVAVAGICGFYRFAVHHLVLARQVIVNAEDRKQNRVGTERESCRSRCRASQFAEEGNKDSYFEVRVYIGEHYDDLALAKKADSRSA